jgi:hypothetical protein
MLRAPSSFAKAKGLVTDGSKAVAGKVTKTRLRREAAAGILTLPVNLLFVPGCKERDRDVCFDAWQDEELAATRPS